MAPAKQRSSSAAERPTLEGFPADLAGAGKEDVLDLTRRFGVDFIRLQFTDIMGINKNVEVPRSQFGKALDGEIMFDGSSIEGFVRIEESDMLLKPDLATFRILPYDDEGGRVARLLCDIYTPDEQPFVGCPRMTLKRQLARAKKLGFAMMAGCEAEFFLFERAPDGAPTTITHDSAAYFDLGPLDKGEEIRRVIIEQLVEMGFEVEAAHHEVATGQHEIDLALRRCAGHGRQPHHLQVHRPQRRQPLRLHRLVHAEADPGRERQRDAHPPVALPGEGERVLRSRRRSISSPGPRSATSRGCCSTRAASARSPTR